MLQFVSDNQATYDITIYYLRTSSRWSLIFAMHVCENNILLYMFLSFLDYKTFLYFTRDFNSLSCSCKRMIDRNRNINYVGIQLVTLIYNLLRHSVLLLTLHCWCFYYISHNFVYCPVARNFQREFFIGKYCNYTWTLLLYIFLRCLLIKNGILNYSLFSQPLTVFSVKTHIWF